jgi:ABC-type dipeptide/oligopeptide/nickel transport system permease subunit
MAGSTPESATGEVPSRVSPRAAGAPTRSTTRATLAVCRTAALLAQRKPLGAISAVIVCGLVVVAVLAPVLAPYDPYAFNLDDRGLPIRMQSPSATFLLGTDTLGRDVLSRIIYGAQVSLIVGLASVMIGTLVGTALGLVSGYLEGALDQVIQRGVDTAMAIPGIVVALAVMSVLGQSLTNIILVIGLVIAPGASRVVRGTVLAIKQQTFIDAAHATGASPASNRPASRPAERVRADPRDRHCLAR